MKYKTGKLIRIRADMVRAIATDFQNEGLDWKAELIYDIAESETLLEVHASTESGVTVRYRGEDLVLYNEEIMLQQQLMERF